MRGRTIVSDRQPATEKRPRTQGRSSQRPRWQRDLSRPLCAPGWADLAGWPHIAQGHRLSTAPPLVHRRRSTMHLAQVLVEQLDITPCGRLSSSNLLGSKEQGPSGPRSSRRALGPRPSGRTGGVGRRFAVSPSRGPEKGGSRAIVASTATPCRCSRGKGSNRRRRLGVCGSIGRPYETCSHAMSLSAADSHASRA